MNTLVFRINDIELLYQHFHFIGLKEIYVLDIYRTNLLREGDIVLDLGAGIGDFSVIASKKVGKNGRIIAIEPNPDDFHLLLTNLQKNECTNVIPLNLGVGNKVGKEEVTCWDRTYSFKVDTIQNILQDLKIGQHIDFIKADIEGFESDVFASSIDVIKHARVISLEFHGTKSRVDEILLPNGFSFVPITMGYIYKKIIQNAVAHPRIFWKVLSDTLIHNRSIWLKSVKGLTMTKEEQLVGSYISTTLNHTGK